MSTNYINQHLYMSNKKPRITVVDFIRLRLLGKKNLCPWCKEEDMLSVKCCEKSENKKNFVFCENCDFIEPNLAEFIDFYKKKHFQPKKINVSARV